MKIRDIKTSEIAKIMEDFQELITNNPVANKAYFDAYKNELTSDTRAKVVALALAKQTTFTEKEMELLKRMLATQIEYGDHMPGYVYPSDWTETNIKQFRDKLT